MDKITHVYIPRWAGIMYILLAIGLIPWIFNLSLNLPSQHLANHWDTLWVGFDIMMLITTAVTIWFAIKKKVWIILSGTALATLFIVDAWFDVMTSKPGHEQVQALVFGSLEILFALLTYKLVFEVITHSAEHKKVKITTRKKHK